MTLFRLDALLGLTLLAACSDTNAPAPQAEAATPAPQAEAVAAEQPTESAPAADKAAMLGIWAADPAWCSGQGEGTPITISETEFGGRENRCQIDALDAAGGGWTASLTCQGEGKTTTERVEMTPEGNRLTLDYLDRGTEPVSLSRCE